MCCEYRVYLPYYKINAVLFTSNRALNCRIDLKRILFIIWIKISFQCKLIVLFHRTYLAMTRGRMEALIF
jgi:hypothetical protein